MRRGGTLNVLGRHQEAIGDLRRAVAVFRRAGDTIWEARALMWRGDTHLALGATERADADFATAARLFAKTSQELESAYAVQDRGKVAFRSGDLPSALSHFDEAARRYAALRTPVTDLTIDRCAVLLAAGLPGDALREADEAIRRLEDGACEATKRAELLLTAARAALAAADPQAAMERAHMARRLFGAQQRTWWHAHAALMLVRARYAAGTGSGTLLREAGRVAARLESLGSTDITQALLVAGRVALDLGHTQDADRYLTAAARSRLRGRPCPASPDGWQRRCAPTRRAIPSACSARAGGGWICSTSTGSPWAPRNCGHERPGKGLNSRNWRSGGPSGRAARGCCSSGASAGGPPRWQYPRSGRLTIPSSRPS